MNKIEFLNVLNKLHDFNDKIINDDNKIIKINYNNWKINDNILFVTGHCGVGKTTFVNNIIKNDKKIKTIYIDYFLNKKSFNKKCPNEDKIFYLEINNNNFNRTDFNISNIVKNIINITNNTNILYIIEGRQLLKIPEIIKDYPIIFLENNMATILYRRFLRDFKIKNDKYNITKFKEYLHDYLITENKHIAIFKKTLKI